MINKQVGVPKQSRKNKCFKHYPRRKHDREAVFLRLHSVKEPDYIVTQSVLSLFYLCKHTTSISSLPFQLQVAKLYPKTQKEKFCLQT